MPGRDGRAAAADRRDGGPGPGADSGSADRDVCPVCSTPARLERCPRCGWTLFTGYLLGDVTDAELRDFGERLAEASRRHGLRCAALAAGYPDHGDGTLLRRLAGLVPGRPAGENELGEARQSAGQLAVPFRPVAEPEAASAVPMAGTLVEIDADGVARTTWERDARVSVELAAFSAWPWTQLLPRWSADADGLAFLLASGQGLTAEETAGLRSAAAGMVSDLPGTGPLFTRCQLTGWLVPEVLLAAIDEASPAGPARRLPPGPAAGAHHGRAVIEAPEPVTALAAVAASAGGGLVRLVTGGSSGAVRIRTSGTADAVVSPGTHRGRVTAVDIGNDGLVASGGRDGTVLAWDADRAADPPRTARQRVIARHSGWVNAVRVTAGRVYSLGDDGRLFCAPARTTAERTARFAVNVGWECSGSLAVTADGGLAAAAGTAGLVRLVNGDTGELVRSIDVGAPVVAIAASGTAGILAVATHDRVRVYDSRDWSADARLLDVTAVSCIDAGASGEVLTGDNAGYVRLFRLPTRRGDGPPTAALPVFTGRHQSAIRAVCLLTNGCVVSGDADGLIRVWPGHRAPKEAGELWEGRDLVRSWRTSAMN